MPAASSFAGHDVEALRLARDQHQEDVSQVAPRGDHRIVFIHAFVRHGAGRDPDLARAHAFHELHNGRTCTRLPRRKVVFQISGHRDQAGAQCLETLAHLLRLRQDDVDRLEHRGKHPPDSQIFGQRPIRNPPVDDRKAGARPPHFAEQVRPHLGFRHHHERRFERTEHPPHDEDVVYRSEEDSIGDVHEFLLGSGASRKR